jgi:hypothetical protein
VAGLGIAGVLLVALVAVGAFFLLRKPAGEATQTAETTTATLAPPTTTAAQTAPTATAEATPVPQSATPPTAPPATQPSARVAVSTQPPATTARAVAPPPAQQASSTPARAEPPASDYSHLDEVPGEEGDGRAAGDALAQKYRSDGQSSYTTGRFKTRPNVPRGITLQERPAVATLLHLNSVEQAYHSRNGKWGTLKELRDAGLLVLDVPVDASGFRRARYAFTLTVESDGFKAEAVPQAPVGRPFVVDDTGKVRFID